MNLLLMGPRASGKTTVGRLLAHSLHWPFLDLDDLALARLHAESIQRVWAEQGESVWRKSEFEALIEALRRDHQIIALGGGTLTIPAARFVIETGRRQDTLRTIYLKCPARLLADRLLKTPGDRPSLTGADLAAEVHAVLMEREPVYVALADVIHETGQATPSEIAADLLKHVH